jgi:release factor glutamine methyltransferase
MSDDADAAAMLSNASGKTTAMHRRSLYHARSDPLQSARMSDHSGPWTVRRLLEWTSSFFARKEVDSPRLSAELLLAHVLGSPRIKLYTDYERELPEKQLAAFRALVQRASEHEPIAYLTGKAHFFNLEFEVTKDVLIPRPDTETLVENVLQLSRNTVGFEAPRVLDLCTGSGCIAAAIAHHLKNAVVIATDVSPAALEVAKMTFTRLALEGRVTAAPGDLYDALKDVPDPQPFNLIVSNPPYIPSAALGNLDRNVRDFEPHIALDGGIDGLVLHRRIIEGAGARLVPGGRLYLEIQFDQGSIAKQMLDEREELEDAKILKDYGGNPRVVTARRK